MEPKPFTVYEHYKGGRYVVINVATHTETGEKLVCYMSLGEENKWWVRPLQSWNEEVTEEVSDGAHCSYLLVGPRFWEVA